MEPTLHDGDWLLVDPDERPALGDLAVAHDEHRLVAKRVVDIDASGAWDLGIALAERQRLRINRMAE